ncbi:unnamed protein product, partial [marine sediment metagenome]
HIPLIYWSLELIFSDELIDKYWKFLKQNEVKLSQKASIIVIQDKERANLLALENGISMSKFSFIPNAPKGFYQEKDNNYWHGYFKLHKYQHIVLNAGSIGEGISTKDIIFSVNKWPKDWVFVIHTRFDSSQNTTIKELHDIGNPNRVFFSTRSVSRLKYQELVASADIGIAFYTPA